MNCGDSMVLNELKERFEKNGEVKFKLFSLEYIIKKVDNKIEIYPSLYSNRKNIYSTLDEALNNFTVYNESIIESIDRVILL